MKLLDNGQISCRKNFTRHMFTSREKEVLELICQGYTNAQIAEELNVSFHTAKAHVAGILRKLEVKNRLMAAIKYVKSVS